MPNPKTGTVTPDVAKAVTDIKGGKIDFRVDKHANLHFIIGKTSFDAKQLAGVLEHYLKQVYSLELAGLNASLSPQDMVALFGEEDDD